MKMQRWVALGLIFICSSAFAGTFTTTDTLIPVSLNAVGTASGDTSDTGKAIIHVDARVYIPDGVATPAPVIVIVAPYGGDKDSGLVIDLAHDFASNGYVVLTPTPRGMGNSEGLVSLAGPTEINDLKTMIVAMQNGTIGDTPAVPVPVSSLSKFGVTGASYGGGQTFEIMRTHVQGLAAVAPIIGWTDLYQALSPNDVPKFSYILGLFASGYDPQNPNYEDQMFDKLSQFLRGQPEDTRTGDTNSVDWRSVIFNPTELTVPVFAIQGWRDWLFPAEQAISLFQASTNIPFFKLYLGGLGHAPAQSDLTSPEALFLRSQLLRWFDHWLKGVANGIDTEPRVTVAPAHTSDWSQGALITSNTFPLPNTSTTSYSFNGSTLSTTGPGGQATSIAATGFFGPSVLSPILSANDAAALLLAVSSANSAINNGTDVLGPDIFTDVDNDAESKGFTSAALGSDLKVIGTPRVNLSVSSRGRNAYYFAQLLEKLPDGTLHLVSRGAIKDKSTGFRKAHSISFPLFSINHTFAAGNAMKLRISTRDFPFFLPNLDERTVKVFHNSKHPSSIDLPVVP